MRVRINLSKNNSLDFNKLTQLLKEGNCSVSFFNSNNVEDDFLYEIEDRGFISKGQSVQSLFENLGSKVANKQILKG